MNQACFYASASTALFSLDQCNFEKLNEATNITTVL